MSLNYNNITYSDSYLIDHEPITKEHQQLFDLAEKLSNCNNDAELFILLQELMKFNTFHFTYEEQFMKSVGFVYIQEDKQVKQNILENLYQYIDMKPTINVKEFAKKLGLFIKKSIKDHNVTANKKEHHLAKNTNNLKNIFKWEDKYKLGDIQIDQEHKKLFEIVLQALNTPKEHKKEHLKTALLTLIDSMQEHFEKEEQYMSYIKFPDLINHQKLHKKILIQMNSFIKSLSYLSLEEFEKKLLEYMDIWLVNHIMVEDKKIVSFEEKKENSLS